MDLPIAAACRRGRPAALPGLVFAATGLLVAWPLAAEPARYVLDPVHTRVLVAVDHAGFSTALGTVSGSEGTLAFDPRDWRTARIDVRVPLQRLDFGDADWNAAARRMLGVDEFPEARFRSTSAEPAVDDGARVCGSLELNGTTRPLCMDVRFNQERRYPMPPFRMTAGFSATTRLARSDFGIDDWPRAVGDEVALRIEAEAIREDAP